MPTVREMAQQASNQLGWNVDFIEKEWALETGHFTSEVWKTDNNPAGIKWYEGMSFGTKGSPANDGGNYAHFTDPVAGYVNFVKNNPRYSNVANSKDPYTEAETIAKDGWATDPDYANKIMSVPIVNDSQIEFAEVHAAAVSKAAPAAPKAPSYQPDNAFHTIQAGETLTGIALHYRVPLTVLQRYNLISNPDAIQAGKTLRIPVSYEVRAGDTITDLARRRNENPSVIGYVNGLENLNKINIGQTLWV